MNNIKFELKANTIEELNAFSTILKKSHNEIFNTALEEYFVRQQELLMKKNQEDENALTNLDFNEFWDDLDLD